MSERCKIGRGKDDIPPGQKRRRYRKAVAEYEAQPRTRGIGTFDPPGEGEDCWWEWTLWWECHSIADDVRTELAQREAAESAAAAAFTDCRGVIV